MPRRALRRVVIVRRDLATGETERVATLRADDGATHLFSAEGRRRRSTRTPTSGRERMGQLTRLLNGKLLRGAQARRRALQLHCRRACGSARRRRSSPPLPLPRLARDGGARAASRRGSAARTRRRSSTSVCSPARPRTRRRRRARRGCARRSTRRARRCPSRCLRRCCTRRRRRRGALWELQRRLTSQLGLQALLTYCVGLRAGTPHSLVLRRDLGSADLLEFGHECLGGGIPGAGPLPNINNELCNVAGVPFRLTRGMVHLMSPLGLSGPFTGAICAAAGSPRQPSGARCRSGWTPWRGPSRIAPERIARPPVAQGLVPWGTTGEAAAARVRNLAGAAHTEQKQGTEHKVDVHEAVQGLIDAATNIDAMCAMPSAFQAWI